MKKVEASGRTLEEALQSAAQQLGVGTDALEYELVEEGTKGFLGLGQTPTTVKAWVSEEALARARRPEPVVEAPPAAEEPEEEVEEEPEAEVEEEPEIEEQFEEQAVQIEAVVAPEPPAEPKEAAVVETRPTQAPADALEAMQPVLQLLREVVGAMGLQATPELKTADAEEMVIELVGQDLSVLVGRNGQTLDALQYIAGIVAHRHPTERRRLILDADGYRDRHKLSLEKLAHEYARAVADEGKEAVLEPQAARDRRIVHLALADDPDVYTYSEGEGDNRHVVISPKK